MLPFDRALVPTALTPAALTDRLRRNGVLADSAVVDAQAIPIGEELGFNGSLWHVTLAYDRDEPSAPQSLIAKAARDAGVAHKLEKESRFYAQFGQLSDVSGPRGIATDNGLRTAIQIGIRIPRAYAAEPGLLLLEDLTSLTCGDVAAGCSIDEAHLITRHLARFHAANWEQPALTSHGWLPRWPIQPERFYARFREFHAAFLERFRDDVTAAMRKLTLRLVDALPQIVGELTQAPATLIHVDTHLDNILFELPDTVVLIDWPSAAVGPAAVDLVRFLAGSLSRRDWRSAGDDLLAEYLRVSRANGVNEYTQVDLRRDLASAGCRLWAGMVTGYGAANPDQQLERQRVLQRVEIARISSLATEMGWTRLLDEL